MREIDLKRLSEECAEVIQAASKMMRFGRIGQYDDGRTNEEVLLQECGDVLACISRLNFDPFKLDQASIRKLEKLDRLEKYELGFDCELTRAQREELHGSR